MPQGRLPDGFGVRVDPRTRSYSGGRVLVGSTGRAMLSLAPTQAALIGNGFLEVTDSQTAGVARDLLDSGVANPRPTVLPSRADVTVVVVMRNDADEIDNVCTHLRGYRLVVVDDGSGPPLVANDFHRVGSDISIVRHDHSRGPIAARNAGIRAATTEFVVIFDADVRPRAGWLEAMMGHFSDPVVALVSPRIVSEPTDRSVLSRFERSRAPLDLGRREFAVKPDGPADSVTSTAIIARRSVILEHGGYDETIPATADIDLCWRLEQSGWCLRYEPIANVLRVRAQPFVPWLQSKFELGAGSAQLALRHPGRVASVNLSAWGAIVVALLATLSRVGFVGALITAAAWVTQIRRSLAEVDSSTRVAALFAARGFVATVWRLVSVLFEHYWPITFVAAAFSKNIRQAVLAIAVAEGMVDWASHHQAGGLDPFRYVILRRVEDLAYGAGVWRGAVANRNADGLLPVLRD